MVSRGASDQPKTSPPEHFAETLPPDLAAGHSFSIQAIFELQRSFGKVEGALQALETKVADQGKTLKSVERILWIATGVVIVAGALGGFAIHEGLDLLKGVLTKH
jgi:hypothetical protein